MFAGENLGAQFSSAAKTAVDAGAAEFTFEGATYLVLPGANDKEYQILGTNGEMKYTGAGLGDEFAALVGENIVAGVLSFEYDGGLYTAAAGQDGQYTIAGIDDLQTAYVSSTFVFDTVEPGMALADEFKVNALLAIYDSGEFAYDGQNYTVVNSDEEQSVYDANGEQFAAISTFVVRRYNGEDSLSLDFKAVTREAVMHMEENNLGEYSFTYNLPQLDENGLPLLDENGNEILVESELIVKDKVTTFVLVCEQYTYMLDRFAGPTDEHPFGTDGDGMDILARMMAGGRISLLVGFVVVILEIILGVIMGGLAGYFGGWVDNIIMRLVDIFYCIPSMPILIILGSMLDSLRVDPYVRLMWLMAVLGFLGWASIARLVRGQILSLREQDFMVATEATGLPVRRRIFRHLIPNVMPQLIVTATMGLGSVILTESTLSFLGLGVKHPMATWGTMINSVATSAQAMTQYTYIWIPVGCLICLTVVAFNFVGDGLRDAFDPKMKR
ncbi:MAG: ABC transporter permease [Oscillospiraceae bacterium]|nr:ABC transporter permease [Oscillospiraceae bacterium]